MSNTLPSQQTPQDYFKNGQWVVEQPLNPQITSFALGLSLGLLIGALILMSKK